MQHDPSLSRGAATVDIDPYSEEYIAEPALLRPAIEEVLRFETPGQSFFRTTTRAVEIGGRRFRPDRRCCCSSAPPTATRVSGTRRPLRHPPARLSWLQRQRGPLVGHMVARMEAEAILGALASLPLRVQPDHPPR